MMVAKKGVPTSAGKAEEAQEKKKTRREQLAKFFFNLALMFCTTMVVGSITPFYNTGNGINWEIIVIGAIVTTASATIAYQLLK